MATQKQIAPSVRLQETLSAEHSYHFDVLDHTPSLQHFSWMRKAAMILGTATLSALLCACGRTSSADPAAEAPVSPKGLTLAGQKATCGSGPRHRVFRIPAVRAAVTLGMGITTTETWTYAGAIPGPVAEVCQGDTVTVATQNQDTDPIMGTDHGMDSSAFQIDAAKFNSVGPGKTLEFTGKVEVPGVFMYHCSVGPATDWHIKSGMYGAMIVYPRESLRDAKEILVVQSAAYGKPDQEGKLTADKDRADANNPFLMMFNGQLEHEPIQVKAGELVRVYFVNAGSGNSAVHVTGSIMERFYVGGNPKNTVYDVQTESVAPGSGAVFEFRPPKGQSSLVDADNLRFMMYGFELPFKGV